MFISVCGYVNVSTGACGRPEASDLPGAEITGGNELTNMSGKLLIHFSSPFNQS